MTSKSIWKRVLNLQLALYTLFWHLNKSLSRNSLRKISTQVLSDQPHLHMVYQFYLLRRKMVHCVFVLTSAVLTASLKRIVIHSCSSPIYWTQVYSKIDLRYAYHLVHITEGNKWKTAFRIRYGSFEWSVMPFGLTNAPMAFQQFMNDIFSDLLDVCVVIYLDNILIYSNNMSEYYQHVKEVLKHLCKAGLYAKAEKCKFHSESVEYLEYILSPSGLTMFDDKIKIIQDWPEPKKVKDIQFFLDFTNFYCWFIFNYLDIVIPLICLTQKDIPWKFNSSCQDAFNSLKKAFTSTPILTYWIPDA